MPSEGSLSRAPRQSFDRFEHDNVSIQRANNLSQEFRNASLFVLGAEAEFQQKLKEFYEKDPSSAQSTPGDIAGDAAHQIAFLRKLKFHYLERKAKDKYVKIIVDDDPSIITVDENEQLRERNEAKKRVLKEAKNALANRFEEIRTLSTQVSKDYDSAQELTAEVSTLTQQILDARLAISRLRTLHPQPRLTVASADRTLTMQEKTMAQLDTELSEVSAQVEEMKEAVQSQARELERLRLERAEKEKEAKECKIEEDDERVVGLYDWFSASLALHKEIFGLQSTQCKSDNELELQYVVRPSLTATNSAPVKTNTVVVTLLFVPGTRQLADAQVSVAGPGASKIDITELVAFYSQCNDVPGLLRSVLARVRHDLYSL